MADNRSKSQKVSEGLADYNDVPARIEAFRQKYPEGRLTSEYEIVREFGGADWIIVKAFAYRSPDDTTPATGLAWERVPGLTPYTKNSELMNGETSSWGRALIALGAADAKRGISSADEIRGREAERDPQAILDALAEGRAAKTIDEAREAWKRARALGANQQQLDELANAVAQMSAAQPVPAGAPA